MFALVFRQPIASAGITSGRATPEENSDYVTKLIGLIIIIFCILTMS